MVHYFYIKVGIGLQISYKAKFVLNNGLTFFKSSWFTPCILVYTVFGKYFGSGLDSDRDPDWILISDSQSKFGIWNPDLDLGSKEMACKKEKNINFPFRKAGCSIWSCQHKP